MSRAARRGAAKRAGKAGRARLAAQADTRTGLADAVRAWALKSKAGALGPVELPITTLEAVNELGQPITIRLVAHVTPNQ